MATDGVHPGAIDEEAALGHKVSEQTHGGQGAEGMGAEAKGERGQGSGRCEQARAGRRRGRGEPEGMGSGAGEGLAAFAAGECCDTGGYQSSAKAGLVPRQSQVTNHIH